MVAPPAGEPMHEIHADAFHMRIWLIENWDGSPANLAPDEHDAIGWFSKDELGGLLLAHDSYLARFTGALSGQGT